MNTLFFGLFVFSTHFFLELLIGYLLKKKKPNIKRHAVVSTFCILILSGLNWLAMKYLFMTDIPSSYRILMIMLGTGCGMAYWNNDNDDNDKKREKKRKTENAHTFEPAVQIT